MEKPALKPLYFACALGLTAAVATSLAAATPAQWAPKDAAVFVEIQNFKEFMEQWKKTVFYRCSQDPQVRKLTEPIAVDIDAKLAELARELGLESIEELSVEPEGGVAFVLLAPPPHGDSRPEPNAAIVADWGGNSAKLKELLEKITARAVERGWQRRIEGSQGTDITSLTPPSIPTQSDSAKSEEPREGHGNDARPEKPPENVPTSTKTICYATSGTVSVLGSDSQLVGDILSRVKKPTPDCLAASAHYQSIPSDLAPTGQLSFVVDFLQLARGSLGTNDQKQKQLKASGFDSFGPFVATVSLAPASGVAVEVRGSLPLLGEKVGLAKFAIDNVVNRPLNSPGDVPPNTVLAWWLNYRFDSLVSDVYELIKRMDPEGAEVFKSQLKVPISETESIDLERLLNSLSPPVKLHAAANPPYENKDVSIVLSIGHSSRANLDQLFAIPTMTQFCQKRELMGQGVYDVIFPPVGASLALTERLLALGNTSGINALVVSTTSAGDAAGSPDPQFQFATARSPKGAAQVFYLNSHQLFEAALALHKQAEAARQAGQESQPNFSMDMTSNLREGLQKIPFQHVEKPEDLLQFAPTILSVTTTQQDGLRFYMNVTEPVKP